ncbi:MAG: hypothetical protein L6Q71_04000 [Planctomycetes bacterium]|nr:hypothetical protein [Planctomycetota bacterium]
MTKRDRTFGGLALFGALAVFWCVSVTKAQDTGGDPSPEQEAFILAPTSVDAGAENKVIRLIANEDGLFSTSSKKSPELKFGTGITIDSGSFRIINPNEAEATIDVGENTSGGVEVRLNFFSLDGTKIIRQEKATLGVIGSVTAGQQGIEVSASEIRLVQVNVSTSQVAGSITLSGKVNGQIKAAPPAGTLFVSSNTPQVAVDNASVSLDSVSLNAAEDSFQFTVANPDLHDITVTISNLALDTLNFANLGGAEGNLSTKLSGAPLGASDISVINAYTALESLEGDDVPQDDNDDSDDDSDDDDDSSDDDSDDDDTATGSSVTTGGNTSSGGNASSKNRNKNKSGSDNKSGGDSGPTVYGGNDQGGSTNLPPSSGGGASGRSPDVWKPSPANSGGAASDGGSSSGGGSASSGTFSDGETKATRDPNDPRQAPDYRESEAVELKTSSKLYFADKEFNKLSSIVLDDKEPDEQRTRVWIVLERGEDAAVFHSDAAGIEIAAMRGEE